LCAVLAGPIPDWRRGPVQHTLVTLVRQRRSEIKRTVRDERSDRFMNLLPSVAPAQVPPS